MELQHLRALVVVAEAGSVTEAARRLLLTQPAVTRQIRALEEELGGALFDRTTKPIAPTPLGRIALEQARRILQMAEDLRARISSDAGTLRGELRLGVGWSLAREVIPPVALELRRRYPGVQLRLGVGWSGALTRDVEDGLLDAAVVLRPPDARIPAGLAARRLAAERVALVSPTTTALRGTVSLEALRGMGWVLNPEGCGYRAKLKRILEEAGIPLSVVVEAPDTDLQLDLIGEGVGPGIVPTRALPPDLKAARLQTFRIAGVTFALEAWLLHRQTGPLVPVAMSLTERTLSALLARRAAGPRPTRPSAPPARRARGSSAPRAR